MSISITTKQAYSEIDEFLELLTSEEKNKIPEKLRDFFKMNKDKYYTKNINPNIPIKEQELKEETLAIIAFLNLKYWCEDEKEKERLKAIYLENERKYQETLKQKQIKKIEKVEKTVAPKVEEIVLPVIKEENIFKKIINKILKMLKK